MSQLTAWGKYVGGKGNRSGKAPRREHLNVRGSDLRSLWRRCCKGAQCDKKCEKRNRQHQIDPRQCCKVSEMWFCLWCWPPGLCVHFPGSVSFPTLVSHGRPSCYPISVCPGLQNCPILPMALSLTFGALEYLIPLFCYQSKLTCPLSSFIGLFEEL